jgi:hypothetical protein
MPPAPLVGAIPISFALRELNGSAILPTPEDGPHGGVNQPASQRSISGPPSGSYGLLRNTPVYAKMASSAPHAHRSF